MTKRTPPESFYSYRSYITGFLLSLLYTLTAYSLVVRHVLSTWTIVWLIALLALIQCMIQLTLFLHLGRGTSARWKVAVFGSMALVVAILVVGSLWIMYNLNYHMLSPSHINTYMTQQDGGL